MIRPSDVISYMDMCQAEGVNLQRGMNFRLGKFYSVILMSVRPGAPYCDRVENDGKVLIYEGHDTPKINQVVDVKRLDQPMMNPGGGLTQNGLFYDAAARFKKGKVSAEKVRVYEKIKAGIWVYNGLFDLKDAWHENARGRHVFKFRLELTEEDIGVQRDSVDLEHSRLIPTGVKLEVWKRDGGACVECQSKDNLHFDHIIPFSKGGSSLVSNNIQLLCARHNLNKRDKIE